MLFRHRSKNRQIQSAFLERYLLLLQYLFLVVYVKNSKTQHTPTHTPQYSSRMEQHIQGLMKEVQVQLVQLDARRAEVDREILAKRSRAEKEEKEKLAEFETQLQRKRQQVDQELSNIATRMQKEETSLEVVHREKMKEVKDKVDAELQSTKDELQCVTEELKRVQLFVDRHSQDTLVKLDVGGRRFKTTRTTLGAEESMLSAMFSGRHKLGNLLYYNTTHLTRS